MTPHLGDQDNLLVSHLKLITLKRVDPGINSTSDLMSQNQSQL